uniref:uncharacterized protein LOC114595395 n=1 Tax=Podarcis muralis TaxID=64176 RepID=UPI00109EE818|nr:uncharacterized protein LOC114595395 [Podarcis muralis]
MSSKSQVQALKAADQLQEGGPLGSPGAARGVGCAGDPHPFHCAAGQRSAPASGHHPGLPGSSAQGAPNPEVLQGGDGQSHSEHPRPLGVLQGSPLSLALAFEALLQLSFMRPHFSPSVVSEILHRTTEAVLGSTEEDKEELKRPFQSLLGGLLLEAPNTGTLLQLLTDLRYYALLGSEDQRKLGASSISLLLALSRRFPNLRNTVIRPELACFRNNLKEDDIIIEEL